VVAAAIAVATFTGSLMKNENGVDFWPYHHRTIVCRHSGDCALQRERPDSSSTPGMPFLRRSMPVERLRVRIMCGLEVAAAVFSAYMSR
jgi:hypothetical protein